MLRNIFDRFRMHRHHIRERGSDNPVLVDSVFYLFINLQEKPIKIGITYIDFTPYSIPHGINEFVARKRVRKLCFHSSRRLFN